MKITAHAHNQTLGPDSSCTGEPLRWDSGEHTRWSGFRLRSWKFMKLDVGVPSKVFASFGYPRREYPYTHIWVLGGELWVNNQKIWVSNLPNIGMLLGNFFLRKYLCGSFLVSTLEMLLVKDDILFKPCFGDLHLKFGYYIVMLWCMDETNPCMMTTYYYCVSMYDAAWIALCISRCRGRRLSSF